MIQLNFVKSHSFNFIGNHLMPEIFNSFSPLRWQDVADILIVSFIIYRAILLIRGTRAVQMLLGLFLVTFIYYLSSKLELLTLHLLLRYLLSSLFFILIIVFQKDIRRALTQMGKTPFQKNEDMAVHEINEIITAVIYMARRRIGALIVIERDTGIRDYIETGFTLNAQLLNELLVAIFFPMSPMHDGAVIIQDGKIHSAGCLLPLSQNTAIKKRYGTRHRAALGLSEETDAVILVISEETQEISIVRGGEITPLHDEEKLDTILKSLFVSSEKTIPLWKKWFNRKK